MNESGDRAQWDTRHQGREPGRAHPFLMEVLPQIARLSPSRLALDVAAGRGRNAIALARAGMKVIAIDYSIEALAVLSAAARAERLDIMPLAADLTSFPFPDLTFGIIVNINFLDRDLAPHFRAALKRDGLLLFDTYLFDQAAIGHSRDPRWLLKRGELRELLGGFDLLRYREGLVTDSDGAPAWRASALARRVE